MQSALYIEINSVGIILLLVILFNQKRSNGSSAQRQFSALIFTAMLMLAVDAACWLVDGKQFPQAYTVSYTVETVYFTLHLMLPYIWMVYTEHTLSDDIRSVNRHVRFAAMPIALAIAGLFFNLRYGFIFSIDANNVYHRAIGVYFYAILAYSYLIYSSIRALAKAKQSAWADDRRRYYTMAFFIVPPFVGGIIQLFYYGINFTWFLATISILQVYIDMQNRQISTDPLTGLNNRRELTKFLLHETREQPRNGALTLIMMDIDGFKQINDSRGHFYGDSILIAVSEILKSSCKGTNTCLSRYGGDEFCVALSAGAEIGADMLISRIQSGLSGWNTFHPDANPIGLSFGTAEWDAQQDRNYEALITRADEMMYAVKKAKKRA